MTPRVHGERGMGAFGALKVLAVATFGTSTLAGSAAAAVDVCNEFRSGPIAVAMAQIDADRVYRPRLVQDRIGLVPKT
jgi:hypothetical protein